MLTRRSPRPRARRLARTAVVAVAAVALAPLPTGAAAAAPGDLVTPVLTITTNPAPPVVVEGWADFYVVFGVEAGGGPVPDGPAVVTVGTTTLNRTVGGGGTSVGVAVLAGQLYPASITYPGTDTIAGAAAGWSYDFVTYRQSQTVTLSGLPASAVVGSTLPFAASTTSGLGVLIAVDGPCHVDGSAVVTTGVGTCSVTAGQLGDGTYAPAAATWDVAVTPAGPQPQTITWDPSVPTTIPFQAAPITLAATATSGLPVTFSVDAGPCTLADGDHLTFTDDGECVVQAAQAGDDDWDPVSTTRAITVTELVSAVAVSASPATPLPGQSVTVTVAVTAGGVSVPDGTVGVALDGSYITDVLLVGGSAGFGLSTFASAVTITVSYPGAAGIGGSSTTVVVEFRDAQTIGLDAAIPDTLTYGDADVPLPDVTSHGWTVEYSTTGPCAVVGGSLQINGAGLCTVTGEHPGTPLYWPVEEVVAVVIGPATQTIALEAALADEIASGVETIDGPFTVPTETSLLLDVSYLSVTGPCEVVGDELRLTGTAGTCHVEASNPGNDDVDAVLVGVDIVVRKAAQTISAAQAIGAKRYGDAPFTFTATAKSELPVTYSASGACAYDGTQFTITGVGTCTIIASQPGDDTWAAAPDAEFSFPVSQRLQTVSISGAPASFSGAGEFVVRASSSVGADVGIVAVGACTGSGAGVATVTVVGVGTCAITATSHGDELTAGADATVEVTVAAGDPGLSLVLDAEVGDRAQGAGLSGSGGDLRPGEDLTLTVYSAPVVVGSTLAEADGATAVFGTLPALSAGTHRAVLAGTALDGSTVSVSLAFGVGADGTITWIGRAVPGDGLAATGTDAAGVGALGALTVLAGVGLVLVRRRLTGVLVTAR